MSGRAARLSGLQKDVLSLYKKILREAEKKTNAVETKDYCRVEFRKKARSLQKTDYRTIEHNIRSGEKFIKLMKMPGFRVVGSA